MKNYIIGVLVIIIGIMGYNILEFNKEIKQIGESSSETQSYNRGELEACNDTLESNNKIIERMYGRLSDSDANELVRLRFKENYFN